MTKVMGSMWYGTFGIDISTKDGVEDFVFLDEDSAIDLFRPLEQAKDSCTRICFGNQIFGVEAALVAKKALLNVQKTLQDVGFAHFVFGRSEEEALKVMPIFVSALEGCTLRSLTLALGDLGEKAVEAFTPLLKSQKTMETLDFISSNISLDTVGAIFKLLPSIESIENLYFTYNINADDAAEPLSELVKKCIALKEYNDSKNYFGICGDMATARYLDEGSRLTMVDFESNMCGVSLSQVISGCLCLTEVYLGSMKLQDERVIAIADSLKNTAPSLRILTVGGNAITAKAAPALAECLAVKDFLTVFYAGDNKLKDDGSVAICKAISEGHEHLEELGLSRNGMTAIGAKAAAEAVANKPYFRRLCIGENFITIKGIEAVKDVLRKGITGESVLVRPYHCKEVGTMRYKRREEGLTDSDTESEEKLQNP